jgi:phosphoserine phosphatase
LTIATLIAANGLDEIDVSRVIDQSRLHRFQPTGWRWLDERNAADIEFDLSKVDARRLKQVLESNFSGFGIDIVVQPAEVREKRLLVADMDSTMIGQECIDELADYAGVKPQVADITARAMHGELDFAGALHERVALLKGLDEGVISQCLAERIRPNAGAATLVRTMRARGGRAILVSGGFTAFVEPIAKQLGFDRFEANVLGVHGGKLTGMTEGRIVDSRVKYDTLVEARERLGLTPEDTLAIGDGANDIPMVEEAGLGIAYRAKPALAAVADARLDHHDLAALLWAQGIPRSDWIEV